MGCDGWLSGRACGSADEAGEQVGVLAGGEVAAEQAASVRLAAPSLARTWVTCFDEGHHQVVGDALVGPARG
jgi:hypothetical protein